jgi:asparagine synthase (glutamine-hydrolysing)
MCGVVGIRGTSSGITALDVVRAMAETLAHRGPDAAGDWSSDDLAMGFRRLAVIDLSPTGAQPMTSASSRLVLAFNGEIYNHDQLRAELEGSGLSFRGRSDTEVLVQAIEHWGLRPTLDRLNGMFAFALWDRGTRVLSLARDRLGEKPLYYGRVGSRLVFASELRALRAIPGAAFEVDRGSLASLLRCGYVRSPGSILAGVRQVPPGAVVELHEDEHRWREPEPYWSLGEVVRRHRSAHALGQQETQDAVHDLLAESVRMRMVADVPVGAFLSGGVDSSLVVALMQRSAARPARTFSIGFDEAEFDEADHARAVAGHLGTDHTELYVTAREALEIVPRLADIYDEPFADSSQIPARLVSELARRDVTVALSGDGADELFGGYMRYLFAERVWPWLARVPRPARMMGAAALGALPTRSWDGISRRLGNALPQVARRRLGPSVQRVTSALPATTIEDLSRRLSGHWRDPGMLVRGLPIMSKEPGSVDVDDVAAGLPPAERFMYLDSVSYLPDDILTKVDRASMSVGLEVRVPFLDHRLVELAWALPLGQGAGDRRGKAVLRQILHRYLPASMMDRPKMGFGVPVASWLRGPLRPWAEELLAEPRLRLEGYLFPEPITQAWKAHLAGSADLSAPLWDVLMFQSWLERWHAPTASPSPCDA